MALLLVPLGTSAAAAPQREGPEPEPCGFLEQPCWTARLACYYVAPPVNKLLSRFVYDDGQWTVPCETQPGAE